MHAWMIRDFHKHTHTHIKINLIDQLDFLLEIIKFFLSFVLVGMDDSVGCNYTRA